MKALEWSQHYTLIFRRSRAAYSVVSSGMWPEFELIQAVLVVFDICKYKKDSIKNEGARVVTTFLPVSVYGDFFQTLKGS